MDSRRFVGLDLLDYGSGPQGVLRYIDNRTSYPSAIKSACKHAYDPLMDHFIALGYDVQAGGVTAGNVVPDMLFDVVFCLNVLDHTAHPEWTLIDLQSHIKPGGRLYLCCDLRPAHLLDQYHKLQITDAWLTAAVWRAGLFGGDNRRLVPHQLPNPTVQWCAVLTKGQQYNAGAVPRRNDVGTSPLLGISGVE
jgi:hypothetical protein